MSFQRSAYLSVSTLILVALRHYLLIKAFFQTNPLTTTYFLSYRSLFLLLLFNLQKNLFYCFSFIGISNLRTTTLFWLCSSTLHDLSNWVSVRILDDSYLIALLICSKVFSWVIVLQVTIFACSEVASNASASFAWNSNLWSSFSYFAVFLAFLRERKTPS